MLQQDSVVDTVTTTNNKFSSVNFTTLTVVTRGPIQFHTLNETKVFYTKSLENMCTDLSISIFFKS